MDDYAIAIAVISLATLWAAWRERAHGDRGDARLLAALGVTGALIGGATWLA